MTKSDEIPVACTEIINICEKHFLGKYRKTFRWMKWILTTLIVLNPLKFILLTIFSKYCKHRDLKAINNFFTNTVTCKQLYLKFLIHLRHCCYVTLMKLKLRLSKVLIFGYISSLKIGAKQGKFHNIDKV